MALREKNRIAVFTKQLDNWRSGSGHHLNEVMKRVLDRNQGRFDFTFLHYEPSKNDIYRRVRELVIPRNPLLSAGVLRRESFDLTHFTPLTIYAPIWRVPGKLVATIHGVEQLLLPQFFGPLEMFHERYLVPVYARRMDGLFSVSNTTAQYLTDHFKVKRERIQVAYNGIGPEFRVREPAEREVQARLGLPDNYIFHVSRFSLRKNPWTLLRAFAELVKKSGYPGALVCAGSGWDAPEVREKARAWGIADRLRTPGFVADDEVAQLMAGAELFVFPSLAEGFGMPNVEAMACGCPVVTSGAFAIPEVVGDAALIVADPLDVSGFANAMARVLDDPELADRLRRRGLARRPLYSWEDAADKLLALYQRVLDDL